jgi:hypothetical protein
MIAQLIRWSIANRFLVLMATALLSAWGVVALTKTPLDALPDLSDVSAGTRRAPWRRSRSKRARQSSTPTWRVSCAGSLRRRSPGAAAEANA